MEKVASTVVVKPAVGVAKAAAFVTGQAFRPVAALGKTVGKGLVFGAKTAARKGLQKYNELTEDAQKLRGQKPGEVFQRKAQPNVYAAPTGCIDVRAFGGTLRRRRFFQKRKHTRRQCTT
jgi:hypothetical protein